jgi:hypothetical protein
MSSEHLVSPAGGAHDPCESLRQELARLATQMKEDVQHLHVLENTPGTPAATLEEWQRIIAAVSSEIEATQRALLECEGPPMKPSLLIVAPSQEFAAALQPLVNHKNLTGMPASVVELAAFIAPQHGRDDAECLKMAIFNHAPAPRYVMLVGDASLMPVRCRRTTQQPVVNSSPYDAWFTAADLYYANLYLTHAAGQGMPTTDYDSGYNTWDLNRDGSYDAHHWLNDPQDVYSWNPDGVDGCPDIAVARLPAHTVADVSAYVSKVIAYETGNLPPSDAVFLADGNYPGANSLADGIVSQGGLTANGLGIQRVGFNYGSSGPPPGYQTGEADDIPGTYTKGLFLIYVGHGDTVGWDIAGVSSAAVADYRNTDFPVVISIGCSTGEWILRVPDHTLPGSSAPPLYHGVDGLLHSFTTDHAIGTFPIQVTDAPTTEAGQAEPPTTWTLPAQSAPKIPIPLPNAYDFNRTSPTFAVSWLFNPQGGGIAFCGETTVGPDNLGAEFATAMFGGWYSTGAVLGDMWLRAGRSYWNQHATSQDSIAAPRCYLTYMTFFGDPSLRINPA